ncbi:MAG: ABC transporter ATP-binding protein [Clostridia bacterium]|nr:ABC transporter ATP-binding protein [Clostridia bacterium]
MQAQQEKDYTQKFDLSLWKKLLHYTPKYVPHLIVLAVFMGVSALIDVAFPLMNGYAIDFLITADPAAEKGLAARAVEGLAALLGASNMTAFILVYALLVCGSVATIYAFLHQGSVIEVGVCYEIRSQGFRKLQELPFSYYDRMPVGYLMSRMTSDIQRLAETIGWSLLDLCWGVVMLIMCSATMLSINWKLGLAVMAVLPPLGVISVWFERRILKAWRGVRKTNSRITGAFNEGIMGAKTTKTLVREEMNMAEFSEMTREMHASSVRAASLNALYLPIVISLGSLATAWALWHGGALTLKGAMTLGVVQVFVNYTVQFFEPVRNIAAVFSEMQAAQAAAERVITLLDTQPDIVDSPEVEKEFGDSFRPRRENWPQIKGDIDFEHVDFQYREGERVLTDFNLHVNAGETIALVGPTGAGKSTVVNLVCRFYEPTAGSVKIDGVDYRRRSQLWLESNLGYVLQEPRLFSGTIRDNIRYGKLSATDEEIERAARLVNAEPFILRMEKGYDTDVGEGGSRLSTGEKQLISFARAILADPRIFILDEATSSVDTETEAVIQQAISQTLKGRTSFIIAHRLSTVRSADRILVIEDGQIRESGTHQELLRLRGSYYRLYMSQFEEERVQEILG